MFYPVHPSAKCFGAYLRLKNHPSKVRLQNWIGNSFFKSGILLRNEAGTLFRLKANDWITRIILIEGAYEPQSVLLATELMKRGGVFIDIGANFGLYSCHIATSNPQVEIIAIEPNFKIIPYLLQNIQLNKVESQIKIFQSAVADAPQFVSLQQPAADNLGTTQTKSGNPALLNIGAAPLGSILQANQINRVKLIKIDIEGNEFSVFKDFDFEDATIENILLEFNHLSPVSFSKLVHFFASKGYQAHSIHGTLLISEENIPENNIWFKLQ